MKTRSVPRHLWPSDRQRVDHAGDKERALAADVLAECYRRGMPRDLAGALKWVNEQEAKLAELEEPTK
jgi:hypothetical protein